MPWKSIEDVPASLKSLDLATANKWGEVFDAVKAEGKSPESAAKIAWSTVRKMAKGRRLAVRVSGLAKARQDRLPGGAADDVDHDELDQDALEDGTEHELEHTDDPELAEEIAADHIVEEGDDYYDKLEDIEKGGPGLALLPSKSNPMVKRWQRPDVPKRDDDHDDGRGEEMPVDFRRGSKYRHPLFHGSDTAMPKGHSLRPDVGGEYGIYLSPKKRYARMYGDHTYEVSVSVKNPKVVEGKYEISPRDLTKKDIEKLKAQGYDSLVVTSSDLAGASEVVLFDPEQAWVNEGRGMYKGDQQGLFGDVKSHVRKTKKGKVAVVKRHTRKKKGRKQQRLTPSAPGLTILRMGMGRDSMTMLCLVAEGKLLVDGKAIGPEGLDAAVFTDTGNEWPHTYELIPRVQEFCDEHGIRLIIQRKPTPDAMNTWKAKVHEIREGMWEVKAPAKPMREERKKLLSESKRLNKRIEAKRTTDEQREEARARLGVIDTRVAELDHEIKAIEDQANPYIQQIKKVPKSWRRDEDTIDERAERGGYHLRPSVMEDYASKRTICAMNDPGCTHNHKIVPNRQLINDLSREKWGVGNAAWGNAVRRGDRKPHRMLIGFAADETHRITRAEDLEKRGAGPDFEADFYPLVEMGIDKAGEQEVLERHGFGDVMKSGCFMCKWQPASWYWALREVSPASYQRVVDYEERARARNPSLTIFKGQGIDDVVEQWRQKHPRATVQEVLRKEYASDVEDTDLMEKGRPLHDLAPVFRLLIRRMLKAEQLALFTKESTARRARVRQHARVRGGKASIVKSHERGTKGRQYVAFTPHPQNRGPDQVGPMHVTMSIDEVDDAIRHMPEEHCCVFATDGRQLFRGSPVTTRAWSPESDPKHACAIDPALTRRPELTAGGSFTHNHPGGFPFPSPQDIGSATQMVIRELRIAVPTGTMILTLDYEVRGRMGPLSFIETLRANAAFFAENDMNRHIRESGGNPDTGDITGYTDEKWKEFLLDRWRQEIAQAGTVIDAPVAFEWRPNRDRREGRDRAGPQLQRLAASTLGTLGLRVIRLTKAEQLELFGPSTVKAHTRRTKTKVAMVKQHQRVRARNRRGEFKIHGPDDYEQDAGDAKRPRDRKAWLERWPAYDHDQREAAKLNVGDEFELNLHGSSWAPSKDVKRTATVKVVGEWFKHGGDVDYALPVMVKDRPKLLIMRPDYRTSILMNLDKNGAETSGNWAHFPVVDWPKTTADMHARASVDWYTNTKNPGRGYYLHLVRAEDDPPRSSRKERQAREFTEEVRRREDMTKKTRPEWRRRIFDYLRTHDSSTFNTILVDLADITADMGHGVPGDALWDLVEAGKVYHTDPSRHPVWFAVAPDDKLEPMDKAVKASGAGPQLSMFSQESKPRRARVVVRAHIRRGKPVAGHTKASPKRKAGKVYDGAKHAKKLRTAADKLQPKIDKKREPHDWNVTRRRASIQAGLIMDAERMEKQQAYLRTLADHAERGTLDPALRFMQTFAAFKMLQSASPKYGHPANDFNLNHLAELAKDARQDAWGPSYHRREKVTGVDKDLAVLDQVIARQSPPDGEELWQVRASLSMPEIESVERIAKAVKASGRWLPGNIPDDIRDAKRALKAGIVGDEAWHAAIAAFKTYAGEARARYQQGDSYESPEDKEKRERLESAKLLTHKGFFPTPDVLSQRVAEEADLEPGQLVLEPSAGLGDMARVVEAHEPGIRLHVGEFHETLRGVLEDQDREIVSRDFLAYNPGPIYDRIVQNPPFESRQDIDHVLHAYDLLKPGGRLVSIISAGPMYGNSKKDRAFRTWLDEVGWSEKLPEGAFKKATRSTGVQTYLVVVDKPE